MVASEGATEQGKGRMVTGRIELSADHSDLARQVTERGMIRIVHDWIVHDLAKKSEIRSRLSGKTDFVNAHPEQGYDTVRERLRIGGGQESLPFENVMLVNGVLNADADDYAWRQWRELRRRPDQTEIIDSSFGEQLEPVPMSPWIAECRPTAERGGHSCDAKSF
jgi:hypothetical protein